MVSGIGFLLTFLYLFFSSNPGVMHPCTGSCPESCGFSLQLFWCHAVFLCSHPGVMRFFFAATLESRVFFFTGLWSHVVFFALACRVTRYSCSFFLAGRCFSWKACISWPWILSPKSAAENIFHCTDPWFGQVRVFSQGYKKCQKFPHPARTSKSCSGKYFPQHKLDFQTQLKFYMLF